MVLDMCVNSPGGCFVPHTSAIISTHTHRFMCTNSIAFAKGKASSFPLMRNMFNTFSFNK